MSISLSLRLVKDETRYSGEDKVRFANRTYKALVTTYLQCEFVDDVVKKEFLDKYLNTYYDLQYFFLKNTGYPRKGDFADHRILMQQNAASVVHQNLHYILSNLVSLFEEDTTSSPEMFTPLPPSTSILLPSLYKVAFQNAWLAHLRHPHPLDSTQLRNLLLIVHKRIIPYMNKPQLLMDWLTDAYNSGIHLTSQPDNRRKYLSPSIKRTMGINAKAQS